MIVRSACIGIENPVVEPIDDPGGLALAVGVHQEKADEKGNS